MKSKLEKELENVEHHMENKSEEKMKYFGDRLEEVSELTTDIRIEIAPADTKYSEQVANLHFQVFSEKITAGHISMEISQNTGIQYILALQQDKVIGYICVRYVYDECSIYNIATVPEFRNKLVASRLLQYLIDESSPKERIKYILEVRVSNIPAINLYKKHQFQQISIRKNYYSDNGEDALILIYEK